MEYVDSLPCISKAAVNQFYVRQGGLLALLYALRGTDMHHQNIIAHSEWPIIIDLETLFHPSVPGASLNYRQDLTDDAVFRVGMLPPARWTAQHERGGLDVSGFGGRSGQTIPFPRPAIVNTGTDDILIRHTLQTLEQEENQPKVGSNIYESADYAEAILDGFHRVYMHIMHHQDALIAMLHPRLSSISIRTVLRPTFVYAATLRDLQHPDLLRRSEDRQIYLERLHLMAKTRPWVTSIVAFEKRALERGDVPVFYAKGFSKQLFADGQETACLLSESPFNSLQKTILSLCIADCDRQMFLIRAALSRDGAVSAQRNPKLPNNAKADGNYLTAAHIIAQRLIAQCFNSNSNPSWFGLNFYANNEREIGAIGDDLYAGRAGIALFFAYCGKMTKTPQYSSLARKILSGIRRRYAAICRLGDDPSSMGIGLFSGTSGLLYLFAHLAALYNTPSLKDDALQCLEYIEHAISTDHSLDIISGTSGALIALLAAEKVFHIQRMHALQERLATNLLSCAIDDGMSYKWATGYPASQPMTGFAHGAAGIAWALSKYANSKGSKTLLSLANKGLTYERQLFTKETGLWPDFRLERGIFKGDNTKQLCAWCHGAAGIGLSRLDLATHIHVEGTERQTLHDEVDAAIKAALDYGFNHNMSLCHGDLGNLEFLRAASTAGHAVPSEILKKETSRIVHSILAGYMPCGTPHGFEVPGLMTGLAGIGLMLLHFNDPDRVPSCLLGEPPSVFL